MSKKHFIAIAKIVDSIGVEQSTAMYKSILVSRLAVMFSQDNERFNSAKFRAACYASEKDTDSDS